MRAAALGLSLVLFAGCAQQPFDSGQAAALGPPADPARLILLTVDNPPEPVTSQAGSTPHGYDALPSYDAGIRARTQVSSIARDYHLTAVDAWPIRPLSVHCVVFRIADGDERSELITHLSHDHRVKLAQPMQTFSTLTSDYNDPYFKLQEGFARINAESAQRWTRGEGVHVAVIDTGLDARHPDLKDRIESVRNFVDGDDAHTLTDRHGTEVTGVIAADANNATGIVGVAPSVKILALKACWQLRPDADAAQCNSFTLARALTAAILAGSQVINLSLGGPADPLLAQLLEEAMRRGSIVVGALPPGGGTDGFPVSVPGVITVGVAGSDNAGAGVLRAPGRDVLTLTPGGHYDFVSGSSLAAAHVSGALALMLSQKPGLPAGEAARLLASHSAPNATGVRMIDVCAALAELRSASSCAVDAAAR